MCEWVEINMATDAGGADIASALLIAIGCNGTAQEDGEDDGEVVVRGYLPANDNIVELIDWLYQRMKVAHQEGLTMQPVKISLRAIECPDWEEQWLSVLEPLMIGRLFLIAPLSLDERVSLICDSCARIKITISAVGGFGTGHHPTTRMCLELMEEIVEEFCGADVLDVGCGSGILSIAAAKLGARSVTAVDIERSALECTMRNASLNGVREKIHVKLSDLASAVDGNYDIILSNLFTELVQRLAMQIRSRHLLRSQHGRNSYWIASGIPTQKFDEATWRGELKKLGMRVVSVRRDEFWVAFMAVNECN
ncbi:MAG: 50S ribosomal protein L11 methyltransferase [Armatimonadota bacterium]|nr:50S ribosomal protein L11 methyltransferase [Armatimonadota bacterium]MCX7777285.1 50S ribosomal protein L11 methyltransferase [Armatimonadota bacterium]MDW8024398.1 50S ribosomal protein L11 methyltransferase [Armatimonadota bacterium]